MVEQKNSCVAVFKSHAEADEAIKQLQHSGFDMKKLSVIGREYHTEEDVVGYYTVGDRMKYWGGLGAFWGGLWGFLFGAAFFWVPGLGPIAVAGPLASWIVGALEGATIVGGLNALGAALFSIGIPKDSIVKYETAIKAGKFVLIVHGGADEVAKAKELLGTTQCEEVNEHLAA